MRQCNIENCDKPARARNWCSMHLKRWQRTGSPLLSKKEFHLASQASEYRIWGAMKTRCYNKNQPHYERYGGRGIVVDKQWLNSFNNFFKDLGPRPSPRHSLDRIDNNGNYEPGNVRWATPHQQIANRRGAKKHTGICHKVYKTTETWQAELHLNGHNVFRKSYKSLQEAIEGRREAEAKFIDP